MKLFILIFMISLGLISCKHEQQVTTTQPVLKDTQDDRPETKIREAISRGELDTVKALIAQGVDVNLTNETGETLLMLAIKGQKYAIVDFLLSQSVDLTLKDQEEKTAMDYALVDEIMVKLINGEALDLEFLSDYLISVAIKDQNVSLVGWILSKGVDPNRRYKGKDNGKFPLYEVANLKVDPTDPEAQSPLVLMAQILLAHPDIDLSLTYGRRNPKTALDKAEERGYEKLVALLRAGS